MSEMTASIEAAGSVSHKSRKHDWSNASSRQRLRRRYAKEKRLKLYGLSAIGVAMLLLLALMFSLIHAGYVAFYTSKVELPVFLDPKVIDSQNIDKANFRKLTRDSFEALFPDVKSAAEKKDLNSILSSGATYILRDYAVAHPEQIGQLVKIAIPLADTFDQLNKRIIPRQIDALSPDRIAMFRKLQARNLISVEGKQGIIGLTLFVDPAKVAAGNMSGIVAEAIAALAGRDTATPYGDVVSTGAADALKAHIAAHPEAVGKTVDLKLPLAPRYSALAVDGKSLMRNPRFKSDKEYEWFDSLKERGYLVTPFTWEMFVNADSRFPEMAGLAGALSGSALALGICLLLSFPIGIATAVYLEEFAPKNRWTDLIEVNINNLAAVPSVVFGLLGLAVFIGFFGLPRSAPLVGGMVLSLMTLPTIIVATRAALKAVPPSIREAALGVGASKHQVMMHHVVPLAMPGILTGTIIGLAQALGETAPLLLIGMNAFIPSIENMGLMQPAMALPTQIYSWADSPERGFVSRTSAAILVLLGFLVIMNILAVWLRNKLERRW